MALTPSQEEALQQLLAVTASSTPSARERDERILREVGWNVQNAVEAIFAGDMEPSTTSAGPSRQSSLNTPGSGSGSYERFEVDDSYQSRSTGSSSRRHSDSYGGRRPNGAGTTGVGLGSIIAFPLKLVFGILTGTWYFIIRNFIPLSLYPRLPRFLLPPSGPTSTYRSARTHNATDSSLAFLQDLESFTGHSASSGSLPELWIGSYRDFMLDIRKQGKVGVVILVSGEHEDDEEFKKEVLGDHELIRLLKEKDVLVWAQDVRSRDGYQAAQTLLVTTYPSLSFCSLLPTNPNSNSTTSPKLSILTSIAGPPSTSTSASSIIQTLTTSVLPRATPFLNRLKRERLSLEEARHLREEQDRAFREAERKDREKLLAQRQTAELERTKVERAEREKSDKEKRQRDRKQWRRYARKHLLTPSAQVTSTTPGAIRVSIRTPLSPERNVRYFVPNTSTEQLFIYAETLLIPKTDAEAQDPDSPPEGYEPEWDFRIVTTFPRKEIEKKESGGEDAWKTVKDAGGALFAEKVEGGTWADEELKELNGDDSDEEVEEE